MATKRPSFLKRQKELKRTARALEKRQARRERKEARSMGRDDSTAPNSPQPASASETDAPENQGVRRQ